MILRRKQHYSLCSFDCGTFALEKSRITQRLNFLGEKDKRVIHLGSDCHFSIVVGNNLDYHTLFDQWPRWASGHNDKFPSEVVSPTNIHGPKIGSTKRSTSLSHPTKVNGVNRFGSDTGIILHNENVALSAYSKCVHYRCKRLLWKVKHTQ